MVVEAIMSAEFDQCAKLILKLDVSELVEIKARIGIRQQMGGATASADNASGIEIGKLETDIDLVLSEIASHMLDEGLEFASVPQLKRMNNFRSFADKVPPTMVYFRKATRNRVKLRALIRMSIKLLYKDMQRMQISASTRTMLNHWHRIPSVINRSFPGYAKAGLLGLLVNSGAIDLKYVSEAPPREE
jgi:hypothetical protein